jgi:hypothetical protein
MRWIVFLTLVVLVGLTSCKKCDPTNSFGGEVIAEAIVRVPGNNAPQPIMVTDADEVSFPIEVSFDNGFTYELVDFSKYTVFAIPTIASCSSGYDRVVTLGAAASVAKYTVTITECATCEGSTRIENWVITKKIPAGYTPLFEVKKQ